MTSRGAGPLRKAELCGQVSASGGWASRRWRRGRALNQARTWASDRGREVEAAAAR